MKTVRPRPSEAATVGARLGTHEARPPLNELNDLILGLPRRVELYSLSSLSNERYYIMFVTYVVSTHARRQCFDV